MDGKEVVRIGYRGPATLAGLLVELIEDDDGRVRWTVPPGSDDKVAVGFVSGLEVENVVGAARLFVNRYPQTRVKVNGEPIGR